MRSRARTTFGGSPLVRSPPAALQYLSACSYISRRYSIPLSIPSGAKAMAQVMLERVAPEGDSPANAGSGRAEKHANASEIARLAETFKVLASPTRLRLIEALSRGELCVCDLAEVAGVSQSAVSHHLASMRALRLVRYRRESRMAFYR